ncbi:hypothetical protein AO382_2040 [Moraxella catarrhalis]|uniref:Uncharacterized protein n=1 Tax=Moraxella catarrhalis TaxID=480 RepID=A0A7Z0UX09_MORCA|nr:hypothetical protein AO382_2040 [Moraxella catarrhalis]
MIMSNQEIHTPFFDRDFDETKSPFNPKDQSLKFFMTF